MLLLGKFVCLLFLYLQQRSRFEKRMFREVCVRYPFKKMRQTLSNKTTDFESV